MYGSNMFSSNNDFFNRVTLWHAYNVSSSTLFTDGADFAMETFMRHTFLNAGIHLYDNLRSNLVFVKNLADVGFSSFP